MRGGPRDRLAPGTPAGYTPRRLLRVAVETGCKFAVDTDAHAPGQLDWQGNGCERAVECGVHPDDVINARTADELLGWTQR